ncbi:IclR family transcriptional regulator [Yinghuangia sp. YIM S09857]|uniref:IclR family transcriptional regulator n=1 Tax=Yinghuangia sp. YIM S09857 TaxID=3436929 RepID=UPI003F53210B
MAERQSPPTERVVQVLNLFADYPDRRWTLTGAAEALGLTKATCLGILGVLTDAGFVTRDAAKSYGLGPALLRVGWAAETGLASLDIVRPHMARLHERLGLACVLVSVHEEHLIVVDRLGTTGPGDQRDLVGNRFPFAPPLGLINVAWADDRVVDAWLAREPLMPLGAGEDATRELIKAARASGYMVERRIGRAATPNIVLANLVASDLPRPVVEEMIGHLPPADWSEYLPELPADDEEIAVWCLSAPIRDRRGSQRYTLTVLADTAAVRAGTCREWAAELMATTRAASAALGGRTP